MSLSPGREAAYDAFVQVMEKKLSPDEALAQYYAKKDIKRIDRNLAKEILFGGLRWYSKILWILQKTATRDLGGTTPEIRAALILGTYQIFYMDRVPDRAAVNESVEYIRKRQQANATAFVNGILRQIARRAEYFAKPNKQTHPGEYLALQYAHPQWIVDRWLKQFHFNQLENILAVNNTPPAFYVRLNTLKTPVEEMHLFQKEMLKNEKQHSDKRPLRCSLKLSAFPDLSSESFFGRGYYTIQNEASQLIGLLVDPKEKETIVDACCGVGGKLTHLAELSNDKANLIGLDKNAEQLQKCKENLERLGIKKVETIEVDFMKWRADKKVDKLLLDAPCSGLGVLRQHPEGKWHKDNSIITKMAKVQTDFLEHALRQIKVGGMLIYSVCSFEKNETEAHLKKLLEKYSEALEVVSPIAFLPDYYKRYVTRDNLLLIYSGNPDDLDGFGSFILRIKSELPAK